MGPCRGELLSLMNITISIPMDKGNTIFWCNILKKNPKLPLVDEIY